MSTGRTSRADSSRRFEDRSSESSCATGSDALAGAEPKQFLGGRESDEPENQLCCRDGTQHAFPFVTQWRPNRRRRRSRTDREPDFLLGVTYVLSHACSFPQQDNGSHHL